MEHFPFNIIENEKNNLQYFFENLKLLLENNEEVLPRYHIHVFNYTLSCDPSLHFSRIGFAQTQIYMSYINYNWLPCNKYIKRAKVHAIITMLELLDKLDK